MTYNYLLNLTGFKTLDADLGGKESFILIVEGDTGKNIFLI
jgi:hypothetical protein